MENKELTLREFLNEVIKADISEQITNYAKDGIAKLDAKNEKRKTTLSKDQKDNEVTKAKIVELLNNGAMVASAVGVALSTPEKSVSTQKASALLLQLVNEGKVVSADIKVKGKGSVKSYSLVK